LWESELAHQNPFVSLSAPLAPSFSAWTRYGRFCALRTCRPRAGRVAVIMQDVARTLAVPARLTGSTPPSHGPRPEKPRLSPKRHV
jgi:hypothetical protein